MTTTEASVPMGATRLTDSVSFGTAFLGIALGLNLLLFAILIYTMRGYGMAEEAAGRAQSIRVEAEAAVTAAGARKTVLELELGRLQSQASTSRAEVSDLTQRQEERNKAVREEAEAKGRVAGLAARDEQLKSDIEQSDKSLMAQRGVLADLQKQVETTKVAVTELTGKRSRLEVETAGLEAKQQAASSADARQRQAEEAIKLAQDTSRAAEARRESAKRDYDSLVAKVADLTAREAELNQNVEVLTKANAGLDARKKVLDSDLVALSDRYTSALAADAKLKGAVADIDSLSARAITLRATIESLTAQKETLQKDLATASESLVRKKEEARAADARAHELAPVLAREKALASQVAETEGRLQSLQQQEKDLRKKMAELEETVKQLERQLPPK